jgi:hypothetical protein
MKKILIVILLLALVGFGGYNIFCSGTDHKADEPKQEALNVSKNSSSFNTSFERLLNSYFSLKDALIDYDTAAANSSAHNLALLSDSLKINEIKGDSTGSIQKVALDFAGTIGGSAKALVAEPDLTKKRREFQMISEGLYNLIRTVKYDGQKLYHQHCPMAFNDEEEAWWISNSNKIENPYLGNKHPKYKATMVGCGDITDSLDFRK